MKLIAGQYWMTVKDLREALEGEPDDAVILIDKDRNGDYRSIYETACAADEDLLFLYCGGSWPGEADPLSGSAGAHTGRGMPPNAKVTGAAPTGDSKSDER